MSKNTVSRLTLILDLGHDHKMGHPIMVGLDCAPAIFSGNRYAGAAVPLYHRANLSIMIKHVSGRSYDQPLDLSFVNGNTPS